MSEPISDFLNPTADCIWVNQDLLNRHINLIGTIGFRAFFHLACLGKRIEASIQDLAREINTQDRQLAKVMRDLAKAGCLTIAGFGPVRLVEINQEAARCDGFWVGYHAKCKGWIKIANLWDGRRPGVSSALRRKVLARDGERCCYCGTEAGPWHIDHKKPVSLGGSDALSNLAVACSSCNLSKGAKPMAEWL